MEISYRYWPLLLVILTGLYFWLALSWFEPISPAERNIIWEYFRLGYGNITNETITIQFRNDFFRTSSRMWGEGRAPFAKCAVKDCLLVPLRLSATPDVLIFHSRNPPNLPYKRLPTQKYVFFTMEPELKEHPLAIKYNLTMTYRLDSDIPIPYSRFKKTGNRKEPTSQYPVNYALGKSKKVAWVVSNCKTNSNREEYVDELKKFIEVDIYGHCGSLHCGRTNGNCFPYINATYKFYLAFENSICQDYVTEKLFRTLSHGGLIPVVMGGANYSRLVPPHSVINIQDFPSPRALADYLHVLDNNDTLYNEYFRWKGHYELVDLDIHCPLCSYLHANRGQTKVYPDIRQWFDQHSRCRQLTWSWPITWAVFHPWYPLCIPNRYDKYTDIYGK